MENIINEIADFKATHLVNDSVVFPVYSRLMEIPMVFVPKKLSPNIISFIGLFFALASSLLVNVSPPITGIFLIGYGVCDTLNWKQRRRLEKKNNPTTELFDHSIDSITSMIIVHNVSRLFDLGVGTELLMVFLTFVSIFIQTCESVITRSMYFRKGIFNPTELLLIIQFIFILHPFYANMISAQLVLVIGCLIGFISLLQIVIQTRALIQSLNDDIWSNNIVDRKLGQKIENVVEIKIVIVVVLLLAGVFGYCIMDQTDSTVVVAFFNSAMSYNIIIVGLLWIRISNCSFYFLLPIMVLVCLTLNISHISCMVILFFLSCWVILLQFHGKNGENVTNASNIISLLTIASVGISLVFGGDILCSFLLVIVYVSLFDAMNWTICQIWGMKNSFAYPTLQKRLETCSKLK